jgi:hypothetical protein
MLPSPFILERHELVYVYLITINEPFRAHIDALISTSQNYSFFVSASRIIVIKIQHSIPLLN